MSRSLCAALCLFATSSFAAAGDLEVEFYGHLTAESGTPPAQFERLDVGSFVSARFTLLEPATPSAPFALDYQADPLNGSLLVGLQAPHGTLSMRLDGASALTPLTVENDEPVGAGDRFRLTGSVHTTDHPSTAVLAGFALDASGPASWLSGQDLRAQVGTVLDATGLTTATIVLSDPASPYSATFAIETIRIEDTPADAFVGAFCFGDATTDTGLGTQPCPCGNDTTPGAGEGCRNSQGHGAILTALGAPNYAAGTFTVQVTQARANQPAMLLEGGVRARIPFKDGLLCAGNPTWRLEVLGLDPTGSAVSGPIIATSNVPGPGAYRVYQVWYRDPVVSVCGAGSNFSSAVAVTYL